jgi:hypothetical protein
MSEMDIIIALKFVAFFLLPGTFMAELFRQIGLYLYHLIIGK